jgi:hypothetical protein
MNIVLYWTAAVSHGHSLLYIYIYIYKLYSPRVISKGILEHRILPTDTPATFTSCPLGLEECVRVHSYSESLTKISTVLL